jgi:hypothetical protein
MNNSSKKKIPEGGPMFPLAKSIADELGEPDLAGEPITLAEFKRCLYRLADLRSGKVHKPKPKLKPWKDEENTK